MPRKARARFCALDRLGGGHRLQAAKLSRVIVERVPAEIEPERSAFFVKAVDRRPFIDCRQTRTLERRRMPAVEETGLRAAAILKGLRRMTDDEIGAGEDRGARARQSVEGAGPREILNCALADGFQIDPFCKIVNVAKGAARAPLIRNQMHRRCADILDGAKGVDDRAVPD